MTTPTDVKKTFWLPKKEVEKFESKFPMHGAMTWFLREALRRFNEITSFDPEEDLKSAIDDIHI